MGSPLQPRGDEGARGEAGLAPRTRHLRKREHRLLGLGAGLPAMSRFGTWIVLGNQNFCSPDLLNNPGAFK